MTMTMTDRESVERIRKYVEHPYTSPDTVVLDSDLVRITAGDLAALLAENEALRGERDEWRKAAQSATPGGSEYSEPHEAAAFIRWLKDDRHDAKKAAVRANRDLKAAEARLERVARAAIEVVWLEYEDSVKNRWTFRKEHVENAILRALDPRDIVKETE